MVATSQLQMCLDTLSDKLNAETHRADKAETQLELYQNFSLGSHCRHCSPSSLQGGDHTTIPSRAPDHTLDPNAALTHVNNLWIGTKRTIILPRPNQLQGLIPKVILVM